MHRKSFVKNQYIPVMPKKTLHEKLTHMKHLKWPSEQMERLCSTPNCPSGCPKGKHGNIFCENEWLLD